MFPQFIELYVLGNLPARQIFAVIRRHVPARPNVGLFRSADDALFAVKTSNAPTHLIAVGEIAADIRGKFRRRYYGFF